MSILKTNRYTICDSSGLGWDTWRYFTGDFQDDQAEAREYIIQYLETWAIYAESYSLKIELDVVAPSDYLKKKMEDLIEEVEYKNSLIAVIRNELESRNDL